MVGYGLVAVASRIRSVVNVLKYNMNLSVHGASGFLEEKKSKTKGDCKNHISKMGPLSDIGRKRLYLSCGLATLRRRLLTPRKPLCVEVWWVESPAW